MSKVVYKYRCFPEGSVTCAEVAKVVLFAEQVPGSGVPVLWLETDPEAAQTAREFVVVGTGHPIPLGAAHVASCVAARGALVWHLYLLPKAPDAD